MKEKLKKTLFGRPRNIYILIANVVINITWVFLLGLFISKSLKNSLIIIVVWSLSFQRLDDIHGTVGYVSAMFPDNTLLITMRGHIVCSKNGVIYDTFDCRHREVENVWLVD